MPKEIKKIAITGHTKNLGKSLFDSLSANHQVAGFSRSNGFDIKNPFQRASIIKAVKDFDVLINLVHNYYHQSDLLLELHKSWKGLNKTIINVSSGVVKDDDWAINDYDMMEYKIQKINLETLSAHLNKIDALPTLITYTISEINLEVDTNNIVKLIDEKIH
jgi:nucleoside-diphosphate-sugar epimerase